MSKFVKMLSGAGGALVLLASQAVPANAFDEVTWIWNADVTTTIDTAVTATTDIAPTGLEQVENEQLSLGTMTSISAVTAIDNALLATLTGPAPVTDLAEISSSATSMGNNGSLESDVSVAFDSQQSFAGVELAVSAPLVGDLADLSLPGLITSTASSIGVLNAAVDNSATGVANNFQVALETTSDQDAFAVGNNVQTSLATVLSTSTVDAVSFAGFADLGTLDSPVVDSSALAVGNNLSVTVDGIN